MNYKLSGRIRVVCLFITIILCIYATLTQKSWLTVAAIVIYAAATLQYSIFHRCPRCGEGFRYLTNGGYCPRCGEKLE